MSVRGEDTLHTEIAVLSMICYLDCPVDSRYHTVLEAQQRNSTFQLECRIENHQRYVINLEPKPFSCFCSQVYDLVALWVLSGSIGKSVPFLRAVQYIFLEAVVALAGSTLTH